MFNDTMRGVTLTMLPTHLIRDAVFGPYVTNEMLYARELLLNVNNDSLTVFDRSFLSAKLPCGLTAGGNNRHFLITAKSNTKRELVVERE